MAQNNSYNGTSVVDYLKSTGGASDFASRQALATSKGIQNYTGTAEQNTQLLGALKGNTPVVSPSQINTPINTPPVPEPRPNGTAADKTVITPATPEPVKTPTLREQAQSKLEGMLTTPTQTREQIKTELGFNEKQKRAQTLESQIQRLTDLREKQIQALEKNPQGVFGGVLESQANKRIRDANREIAQLNVEYKTAQNDFVGAQQAVQDRLKDIQDQKDYDLKVFTTTMDFLNNDLTESEKLQMQHNLQMNQIEYEAQKKKEQAKYEYQLATGDFSGSYPGEGQVSTSTGNYDVSTYATDPLYADKLQTIYDGYKDKVNSPESADAVIKASAPGSKLTGQLVYEVANANGIDPVFLMTQLKQESNFGTVGAATKNTNFGGVKYVGQANAKQGTLSPEGDYYANFNTVRDALDTQAKEVAKRKVAGQTSKISPAVNNAINDLLGISGDTDANAMRFRSAVLKSSDPITVIKNKAKNQMTSATKTDTEGLEKAMYSMEQLEKNLDEYYKTGESTSIFTGFESDIETKIGTIRNERAKELATQIASNLQAYRKAISGTAYSNQESKEIQSIFPGINKTERLNKTIISGRKTDMQNNIDGNYRSVLGDTYDKLKAEQPQAVNSVNNQDIQDDEIFTSTLSTNPSTLKTVWGFLTKNFFNI